jgi:hypothetical protein
MLVLLNVYRVMMIDDDDNLEFHENSKGNETK